MNYKCPCLSTVKVVVTFLVGLIVGDCIVCQPELSTLRYVAVVTRHGSRSPTKTYPNDPYPYNDPLFWPDGPGDLTNVGKVQLYHTGQYLRARYNGYLNSTYSPSETTVTYNPYNRDYTSAACLTASLYPPVGDQIWNSQLTWQPVVQSQRDFDICDLANNNMCPKYKQLCRCQTEQFNGHSEKFKDLLDYVSANAGENYTALSEMNDMYDTLLMQEQNGYKLQAWTKKIYPDELRPISIKYSIETLAGNDEQIRLAAGPELKHISNLMNAKVDCSLNCDNKMYIEAAHDCTLLLLLRSMGSNDSDLEIQTGAYLLFELHYLQPDYIVQVYYFKNSYDLQPDLLDITECPNPCSLKDFNKFVDSVNPPDYQAACQILN